MNPFFQDESNAVYHGNALTILPCLPFESVDAVITDPPYCSGIRKNAWNAFDLQLLGAGRKQGHSG